MSLSSPTQSLCKLINRTQQAITNEADALSSSLLATRLLIIEPILHELGWDIHNQSSVEIETNGSNTIYRLNINDFETWLELHCVAYDQALPQIQHASTHHVLVSNGNYWATGNQQEYISLLSTPTFNSALFLISKLDRQQIAQAKRDDITLSSLYDFSLDLENELNFLKSHWLKTQNIAQPSNDINQIIKRLQVQAANAELVLPSPDDPRFIKLNDITIQSGMRPLFLRLPDNRVLKIGKWTRMLVKICTYLLEHTPNLPLPLKDRVGKTVNLISLEPIPEHLSSTSVVINGQTRHIYTNYDSNNSLLNSLYALSYLSPEAQETDAAIIIQEAQNN